MMLTYLYYTCHQKLPFIHIPVRNHQYPPSPPGVNKNITILAHLQIVLKLVFDYMGAWRMQMEIWRTGSSLTSYIMLVDIQEDILKF